MLLVGGVFLDKSRRKTFSDEVTLPSWPWVYSLTLTTSCDLFPKQLLKKKFFPKVQAGGPHHKK